MSMTRLSSHQITDHLKHLEIVFNNIHQHQLKMNQLKCVLGVTLGKFMGFIIRHRGVEVDPTKIILIIELPPPENIQ